MSLKPKNIKKFIYGLFNKVKSLHERIKSIEENNPYTILAEWSLDTLQYGFAFTFLLNVFAGWQGINNLWLLPGFGVARWLFLDSLRSIIRRIKE